jgi:lipopolysaccharide transport system permease protein
MQAYQDLFLKGAWPDWASLLPLCALGLLLCIAGLALFRGRSGEMVDEL